jgi:hypothetical protein
MPELIHVTKAAGGYLCHENCKLQVDIHKNCKLQVDIYFGVTRRVWTLNALPTQSFVKRLKVCVWCGYYRYRSMYM